MADPAIDAYRFKSSYDMDSLLPQPQPMGRACLFVEWSRVPRGRCRHQEKLVAASAGWFGQRRRAPKGGRRPRLRRDGVRVFLEGPGDLVHKVDCPCPADIPVERGRPRRDRSMIGDG